MRYLHSVIDVYALLEISSMCNIGSGFRRWCLPQVVGFYARVRHLCNMDDVDALFEVFPWFRKYSVLRDTLVSSFVTHLLKGVISAT